MYILTLPKLTKGSEGGSLHFQFRVALGFASVNYNEFRAEMKETYSNYKMLCW